MSEPSPTPSTPTPANLLALEPELVGRLRARVPAQQAAILTAHDYDAMVAGGVRAPAVYVIYAGGVPVETSGRARQAIRTRQDWLIVPAARHAAAAAAGEAGRTAAGTLAAAALSALLGWQPAGALHPLTLVALPDPGLVAGAQLVPFVLSTEILITVTGA